MKRFCTLVMSLAIMLFVFLPDIKSLAEESAIMSLTDEQTEEVRFSTESDAQYQEESLNYAILETDPDESTLLLDVAKISDYYGAPVCIYAIVPPDSYPERARAASKGEYSLDVNGVEKYLLIEDKEKNSLWAGVYGGYQGDVPRALLYYSEVMDNKQTENDEPYLILDLSEVAAQYGDVSVDVAKVGKKYSAITVGEDQMCRIESPEDDKYIRIVGTITTANGDTSVIYLWCGFVQGSPENTDREIVFHVADDPVPTVEETKDLWNFEINRVDEISVAMTFKVDGISELIQQHLWIHYEFQDENGKVLESDVCDKAPNISLIGTYNYNIGEIPEGTAKVTVRLIYRGKEVGTAEYVYKNMIAENIPNEIVVPIIELTEQQVTRQAGGIKLSGTVYVAEGNAQFEDWEFVINGEVCIPDEQTKIDEERYSFAFNGYLCAPEYSELTIMLRHHKEQEIQSEEQKIEINEQSIQLLIDDYDGIYDGRMHTFNTASIEEINFFYSDAEANETADSQIVWNEGLPQLSDVGEQAFYVRAEKEGCTIEFVDEEGNKVETEDGYARAVIRISPAPVRIKIWAEQTDETIEYNDRQQMIQAEYKIELLEDASGLFDISKITEHKQWKSSVKISAENAGEYAVEHDKGQFDFIKDIDSNFDVSVEWEPSSVVINKKQITLMSVSDCIVYGAQEKLVDGRLINDQRVDGTKDIINYYSGDVTACGSQEGVGVSRNTIDISGAFADKQENYDITKSEGILIVFPQSIDKNDPLWSDVKDQIDEMVYADASAEELPGYYYGMGVELQTNSGIYDGEEHDIQIRFRDSRGASIDMKEGRDYKTEYLRSGKETQDLTSAGLITIQVYGIGNYTGNTELTYEIQAKQIENIEISIENWVYDGECAGSDAHPLYADSEPDRYVYFDESNIEMTSPPVDAGSYTVQAVWDSNGNYQKTESERCAFEILPAMVTITVQSDDVIKITDTSGLFDEAILVSDRNEYTSSSRNFVIEVEMSEVLSTNDETVSVQIEDWIYDGSAANSQSHKIIVNGTDEECRYRFYDETGTQTDAPIEAGTYRVVASWGYPEGTAETTFTIKPLVVTLKADDVTKVYGAEDPELIIAMSEKIDNVDFEIVRQKGEDVGEYVIDISGASVQGSYELVFEPGIFTIQPKPINSAKIAVTDDGKVTVWEDGELQEDVDYILIYSSTEMEQIDIQGIGNYTGTISTAIRKGEREIIGFSFEQMIDNKILWIAMMVIMLSGTIICGVRWHKLNQQLNKERLRLLDAVSRQSNRTIRETQE